MPRFTFSFGFLLTLSLCFAAPSHHEAYAMGSKSGFEQADKREPQKEQPRQETEKGKGAEKGVRQENAGENRKKSSPAKKPRLKYRDLYECGC